MRHGNKPVGWATWHEGLCDICGNTTEVTEPRDFGHLKDTWEDAAESRSDEQQNGYPYVEVQGNIIAELSSRNNWLNKELTAVTEQRDVAIQCHKWCYEDRKRIIEELTFVTEHRDGLRSCIDYVSDQLHTVTEQRDRLAEALNAADECLEMATFSKNGYTRRVIDEALQSLTLNKL